MRLPTAIVVLAAVALIVLGGFLLFGGAYTTHRDLVAVGSLEVGADQKRTVSPWIASAAIMAGVGLLFTTLRKKK
jgi:hypothetical protein